MVNSHEKSHFLFLRFPALVEPACLFLRFFRRRGRGNHPGGGTDVCRHLYPGNEDSNFNPCIDREESWQLNVQDTTFGTKLQKANGNPVYIKLRGVVSTKGEYRGFFAVYDRRFEVEEVIEVTSTKRKHCF